MVFCAVIVGHVWKEVLVLCVVVVLYVVLVLNAGNTAKGGMNGKGPL